MKSGEERREKLEQDYQVRQYTADVKQDSKSLRAFSKKARDTGTKNLLLSLSLIHIYLYMAVSTLQLTSIRNLSEYWQLLLKHTSRGRSIVGFHILLSDTAVESCVTFKPRKAPIQLIQFSDVYKRQIFLHSTGNFPG